MPHNQHCSGGSSHARYHVWRGRYLAVESHTVDTVVVAIEGLGAEASPGVPDGDSLVRGGSAEAAAERLPAHLVH